LIDCCVFFIDFIVTPLSFIAPLLPLPPPLSPHLSDFCVLFYRLYCRPAVDSCVIVVAVVFVTVTAIN
jgi:hypothetical protein